MMGSPLRAADLPVTIHVMDVAEHGPGACSDRQVLGDFELVWIVNGCAEFARAGADPQTLQAGTLLLVQPGTEHVLQWDRSAGGRHAYARFHLDAAGIDPYAIPVSRAIPSYGPLPGLLDYLTWMIDSRPDGAADRAADVIGLILTILMVGPLPSTRPESLPSPLVQDAVDYVRREWAGGSLRAIRLGELAASASVSSGHFSRHFQEHYGIGPATALERLRLTHAAGLLVQSDRSLADIARECGFADPYHFSRRFSALYQLPPGRFRRERTAKETTAPLLAAGLLPIADQVWQSILIEQSANTSAPPPLAPKHAYGQAFTVPDGLFLTHINMLLGTYRDSRSGVTITLWAGNPDQVQTRVAVRRIEPMTDNTSEALYFPAQPGGPFFLEISDPRGTPTWWWHQGSDTAHVGGGAYIDRVRKTQANFVFRATAARHEEIAG